MPAMETGVTDHFLSLEEVVPTPQAMSAAWRLNKFRTDTPAALKRRSGSL